MDSEEDWKSNCEKAVEEIFSVVTYRKVPVPVLYCGQLRTECCQRDEFFVEWIQEESSLLVYGFKEAVAKEARRLEDLLFDLKVSCLSNSHLFMHREPTNNIHVKCQISGIISSKRLNSLG